MLILAKYYIKIIVLFIFCIIVKTSNGQSKKGLATFYAHKFQGRRTATGQIFKQSKFTAASNSFKLGTMVRVTNPLNNLFVDILINDRMHPRMARKGRIIDMSTSSFKLLKTTKHLLYVTVETL